MTDPSEIGTQLFFVTDELEELTFDDEVQFDESFPERRFSWLDTTYLAAVSDQRPHNTCTSHALARAHETLLRQKGVEDIRLDADQFHQCVLGIHTSAGVTDVVAAIRMFYGTGAPRSPNAFQPGSPCPNPQPPLLRCSSAKRISDADAAKQALLEYRPIVALMSSERRFLDVADFSIFRDTDGPKTFHHAILVVGFDEDAQCWEIQNSFGKSWGSGGRGRIAYGHASLFSDRDHVGFLLI
jgi:C1A family cysteine protease